MKFRVFDTWSVQDAIQWAGAAHGNVAVHLHATVGPSAPGCFRKAVNRGERVAHVFCQDAVLLAEIARRLGAAKAVIERVGRPGQHVDLCGRPLAALLATLPGAKA